MTDAPKLLPCPFCGSSHVGWHWVETYSIDSSYATFGCLDCGVSFAADDDHTMHPDDVAAWNRRAALKPAPTVTAGWPTEEGEGSIIVGNVKGGSHD